MKHQRGEGKNNYTDNCRAFCVTCKRKKEKNDNRKAFCVTREHSKSSG